MRVRNSVGLAIVASVATALAATAVCTAEVEPSFAWMADSFEGNASLVYGSTETGEDMLSPVLRQRTAAPSSPSMRRSGVRSPASPLTLEIAADTAKVSLKGQTATDEMNGFVYATLTKLP